MIDMHAKNTHIRSSSSKIWWVDFLTEEMNIKLLGWGIAEKNNQKTPLWYTSSLARNPLSSKDVWYIVGLYNTKPEYGFPHNFCSRFRARLIFPTCVFVKETRKKSWETLYLTIL